MASRCAGSPLIYRRSCCIAGQFMRPSSAQRKWLCFVNCSKKQSHRFSPMPLPKTFRPGIGRDFHSPKADRENYRMNGLTKAGVTEETGFADIVGLIAAARQRAFQAVNTTLIDLYWQVGEYISRKIETAEWGEGVVPQLAQYIAQAQPGQRGFTRSNLFRMKQLYETYRSDAIVAALPRQLSWTHNLIILGQSKRPEEREFYLRMAIRERWRLESPHRPLPHRCDRTRTPCLPAFGREDHQSHLPDRLWLQ